MDDPPKVPDSMKPRDWREYLLGVAVILVLALAYWYLRGR